MVLACERNTKTHRACGPTSSSVYVNRWETRKPCEQCTRGPQELDASSRLSLGRCTEPEWNRNFVGQGAVRKASWTTEQSMNKACSQQGTGYIWGPALPGRRVSRITEKAANGGQALTVEGRAEVSSWSQSSRQQEEIKDFSNPHAVLWGWEQRRHWV